MSSSDSEDDCYTNVAKKLRHMKQQYKDTGEEKLKQILETPIEDQSIDYGTLEDLLPPQAVSLTTGRVTRSRNKKQKQIPNQPVPPFNIPQASPISSTPATVSRSRPRKSKRGRTAKTSSRAPIIHTDEIIPVGDVDLYPDDGKALFKDSVNVLNVDYDADSCNEELSVKVYWKNWEVQKFLIRRHQKITQIFKFFADREKVDFKKLFFMYNDKILHWDDTPDSFNYNICKFIDGGIVDTEIQHSQVDREIVKKSDGLTLKFQFQKSKPFETIIGKDDKLIKGMVKCAEYLEKPINLLKFYFDGDLVDGNETLAELEFEGGECIDVKCKS